MSDMCTQVVIEKKEKKKKTFKAMSCEGSISECTKGP